MSSFLIDIWEIFLRKSPDLYMKAPPFVVKWLAKLVRQEQFNEYLRQNPNLSGIKLMEKLLSFSCLTIHWRGVGHLPNSNSRCIFVSNHPLGGMDGICLSVFLGKKYHGNIKYVVNDILSFIKPCQGIFIPVSQRGIQSRNSVKRLNEAFASKNQIIVFPAGICSRKIRGKVIDLEWKKMFISKAIEYQREVVPIYFKATNSFLFYMIANIRKRLGLKFNIELFLLPREMFKIMGSTFIIQFGKPIPWQTFNLSKTTSQWADEVKNQVYSMQI